MALPVVVGTYEWTGGQTRFLSEDSENENANTNTNSNTNSNSNNLTSLLSGIRSVYQRTNAHLTESIRANHGVKAVEEDDNADDAPAEEEEEDDNDNQQGTT